jgi:hypothetical protein
MRAPGSQPSHFPPERTAPGARVLLDLLTYAATDPGSGCVQGIPARRLEEVDDRQMQWVSDAGLAPLLYRASGEGIDQVRAARRKMLLKLDIQPHKPPARPYREGNGAKASVKPPDTPILLAANHGRASIWASRRARDHIDEPPLRRLRLGRCSKIVWHDSPICLPLPPPRALDSVGSPSWCLRLKAGKKPALASLTDGPKTCFSPVCDHGRTTSAAQAEGHVDRGVSRNIVITADTGQTETDGTHSSVEAYLSRSRKVLKTGGGHNKVAVSGDIPE